MSVEPVIQLVTHMYKAIIVATSTVANDLDNWEAALQ